MKINIVAVGKIKEKFYVDAISEYAKRLSRFCDFKVIEVNEATNYKNLNEKSEIEGKSLLAHVTGFIVALDGKGKMLSSEEFAEFIQGKMIDGISEISFVIGGSNGLSLDVKEMANFVMSFGKITFPHQLFRVVLSEQVYRAFTIINKMPYHK